MQLVYVMHDNDDDCMQSPLCIVKRARTEGT
jgi:hypothetical protein